MKVSIIVPVYNGFSYLKKCLDSLINQTYKNIEILIVNDGSTDDSIKILNKYQKKDNRIILIDKQNEGQAKARNLALSKASGEYILFVDCDDYIELSMVEDLLKIAIKENSDIVSSDLKCINEDGNSFIIKGIQNVSNDNSINFLLSDPGPCAKLFKTSFLNKNNFKFLENRIYEDLATIPVLATKTKNISYINSSYYNYIIHNNSTMKQKKFNFKLNDIFYSIENLSKQINGYEEELEYIYIKHLLHDASLRFLNFNCKESKLSQKKIINIMKTKYPNWKKNKYLNLMSKKEILLTKLIYRNMSFIYKLYRKVC